MYETAFGFTGEEVLLALEDFGLMHEKEEVRRWYDGFRFGNCGGIYNPWPQPDWQKRHKVFWKIKSGYTDLLSGERKS